MSKRIAVQEQAKEHGDFYVYYTKQGSNSTTYAVGTTDYDNWYIKAKGAIPQYDEANEFMFFSWTSDKFRVIPYDRIRTLSPLSAEINNEKVKR
jgi:hypothetical protein